MSLNQVTIEIPLNIQKGLDSVIYKSIHVVQNFLFINYRVQNRLLKSI